jgi:hypothetical protein
MGKVSDIYDNLTYRPDDDDEYGSVNLDIKSWADRNNIDYSNLLGTPNSWEPKDVGHHSNMVHNNRTIPADTFLPSDGHMWIHQSNRNAILESYNSIPGGEKINKTGGGYCGDTFSKKLGNKFYNEAFDPDISDDWEDKPLGPGWCDLGNDPLSFPKLNSIKPEVFDYKLPKLSFPKLNPIKPKMFGYKLDEPIIYKYPLSDINTNSFSTSYEKPVLNSFDRSVHESPSDWGVDLSKSYADPLGFSKPFNSYKVDNSWENEVYGKPMSEIGMYDTKPINYDRWINNPCVLNDGKDKIHTGVDNSAMMMNYKDHCSWL